MALPAQTRTYSTRRNIPLLDTSTTTLGGKSWALALFRSMTDIETTGTLGGTRHANSVWSILRTCDGTTVSASNLWTGLSALVNNSNGSAHSWAVLENVTLGYQFCIDLNTPGTTTSTWRLVATKIANPFSTGTTTAAPYNASEFQAGVFATGLGSVSTQCFQGATGGTNYFHYTTADDGQCYTLMNRLTVLSFTTFFGIQRTENAGPSDTENVLMMMTSQEGGAGVPAANVLGQQPAVTGRTPDGVSVWSSGGIRTTLSYGNTSLTGTDRIDQLRNQYPCWKPDIFSIQTNKSGFRGNFVDFWCLGIVPGRVGQVYPTAASPQYVVAGDFLVPFVGAPPTL